MKDRIRQLMEAQHMNQQTFAQYTGIGSASLSSIFTGRTNPTLKHVDLIIEKFPNVNPMWLLKGQGGMLQLNGEETGGNSAESPSENSDVNSAANSSAPQGAGNGQGNGMQGDLFNSANMSVQPSLFDNATSTPSGTSSPATSSISPNCQNNKRANSARSANPANVHPSGISGMQMNFSQQNMMQQALMAQQNITPPTPPRKITEIRIFYDDQTWESFVPKK